MTDYLHAVLLALLQGFTEFLPISSAAHLILMPRVLGWEDQGLAFDVAVHVGSLAAVLVYFRRDLAPMIGGWFGSLRGRPATPASRLAWAVVLGTIPAGLAGLAFKPLVETTLRNTSVIAFTTVAFGLLLGLADWRARGRRDLDSIGWRDWLFVGVAQALALVPGTSRSGITMTAGLFAGMTRESAARYSFLLAVPIVFLAGLLDVVDLVQARTAVHWDVLGLGAAVSGVAAYLCIHFFLRMIGRIGMLPFVVYRLFLGAVIVWLL